MRYFGPALALIVGGHAYAGPLACTTDQVLVGIAGRGGASIAKLDAALCVPVMADGKWSRTPQRQPAGFATPGKEFQLQCAPHHVVTGVAGRASGRLDAIGLRCGALGQDASGQLMAIGAGPDVAPVGGAGGAPFAEACAGGMVATRIELPSSGPKAVRIACVRPSHAERYGVESLALSRDTVRPGESAVLTITLKGPAGPDHRTVIHKPPHGEPPDFTAVPGWTVTVPPRERSVSVRITANANARPAFGGPYVDLKPDYDPAAPTRRLTIVRGP